MYTLTYCCITLRMLASLSHFREAPIYNFSFIWFLRVSQLRIRIYVHPCIWASWRRDRYLKIPAYIFHVLLRESNFNMIKVVGILLVYSTACSKEALHVHHIDYCTADSIYTRVYFQNYVAKKLDNVTGTCLDGCW